MGRYQSALHNRNGKVIIAGEIHTVEEFSNEASTQKANCRNVSTRSGDAARPDGKYIKYLHAHCYTNQSFTRSFNNTWKINTKKNNRRSDWWPAHHISISGYKYNDCEAYNPKWISKSWSNGWIGYLEVWHVQTNLPAHLHPYDHAKFIATHKADGLQLILYM
jgi:hypothetical protein